MLKIVSLEQSQCKIVALDLDEGSSMSEVGENENHNQNVFENQEVHQEFPCMEMDRIEDFEEEFKENIITW